MAMFFWVMVVFLLLGAPLVLSIIALVFASNCRGELRRLQARGPVPDSPRIPTEPEPMATPSPPQQTAPATTVAVAPVSKIPEVKKGSPKVALEATLGGKVASFIGIGVLLLGIAFLVGYAIRNAWLGPGARVIIGLISGGALVVLGHLCETKGAGRLWVLARALTGGGAALFYFTIFAAYGIYNIIPALLCGVGLIVAAAAAVGLALAYGSQAVALVGVMGAFITPLLIGADYEKGVFPLAYIAIINVPVVILGVRRKWQLLYNIAFALTVLFTVGWLDWFRRDNWIPGIVFSTVYFLEFAGLGLLKLRGERRVFGRSFDVARLCLNSGLYMLAIYWLFDRSQYSSWTAAAFIAIALLHIAIARAAWRWLPTFTHDTLAFLVGGLGFACLALPIQLDGAWVSCGWAIMGLIICWFALRVDSFHLRIGGLLLGLVGLIKTLVFDVSFYRSSVDLFLNARFASGLICIALLAAQGWLSRRVTDDSDASPWSAFFAWAAVLGLLAVFYADAFWNLGFDDAWAWTLTTTALLLLAVASSALSSQHAEFSRISLLLFMVFPFKVLLDILVLPETLWWRAESYFFNLMFVGQFVAVAVAVFWLSMSSVKDGFDRSGRRFHLSTFIGLASIVAGISLVTSEFMRIGSDWASTAVTIWWAVAAISLAVFGLVRDLRRYRYAGLLLFSLVLLKMLTSDISRLQDLERVIAFIGVGLLMLVLSFLYQRMAAKFIIKGGVEDE